MQSPHQFIVAATVSIELLYTHHTWLLFLSQQKNENKLIGKLFAMESTNYSKATLKTVQDIL